MICWYDNSQAKQMLVYVNNVGRNVCLLKLVILLHILDIRESV